MVFIILGIVLTIGLIFLFAHCGEDSGTAMFAILVSVVFAGGICAGLFVPVKGYTDWKEKERIDLVSLNNSTVGGSKGFIYVSVSSDNVYSYRHEVDSEFGTKDSKEYVLETVLGSKVVEVEDPTIDTPYLIVYERKGKKSIWSFALLNEQQKYVFYVPEGSIERATKLK